MANIKIYKSIPDGWKVREGATTAPNGFVWIWNVKSLFSSEYRAALVPIEAIKR